MSIPVETSSSAIPMDYQSLRFWAQTTIESGGGDLNKWFEYAARYDVDELQAMIDVINDGIGVDEPFMNVYQNADGQYMATFYNATEQVTTQNPIVSNATTTSRANIRQMLNRGVDSVTNKLNITRFPVSGGLGQQAAYVVGSVGSAVGAVATGISLGKWIDSTLYNANPTFWEDMGLEGINPETWATITNGDNSPYAGLFNMILGIDPTTGKGQMYMDENAFAYMAYALAQNGFFSGSLDEGSLPSKSTGDTLQFTTPNFDLQWDYFMPNYPQMYNNATTRWEACTLASLQALMQNDIPNIDNVWCLIHPNQTSVSISYFDISNVLNVGSIGTNSYDVAWYILNGLNGRNVVYSGSSSGWSVGSTRTWTTANFPVNGALYKTTNRNEWGMDWSPTINDPGILYAYDYSFIGLDGVTDQTNATLPDVSGWNDLSDVLPSLQQQYPDMFSNPLIWDNYQPDGTNPQLRYVPVGFPTFNNALDTQPLAQTQTQTDTALYPDTTLADLLKSFTETATQTSPQTSTPPANPTDTGTGDSPTPLPIIGSASALWSVYHPTQSQVNDFGAWLWGSPFLTNIGKLFSNPIEGVISLHKVFAPPVDSGNGTIVVGTLDSEVPSATVNQQYVFVDCGSVDLLEQFSNVFDYPPFTEIHIYLPFIGIVPLDTNDVMRSTIHVTYGVDIFTGACLAMVEVTRDGSTVNLYQYAGSASVEYPLSNVQNGQLLAGILSAGAGIASIALTGGVSAPAVGAIVGGAASAAKSNVGRSGGFSGNSGAMGIKTPYLIIKRPQTKVANTFPYLEGYPTNYSTRLGDCSGHVIVKSVHVEGMNATDSELSQIETLLKDGILI